MFGQGAWLHSETFKAERTAPMGLAKPVPIPSPAKLRATALVLESTTGEPESPGALMVVKGEVGEYEI